MKKVILTIGILAFFFVLMGLVPLFIPTHKVWGVEDNVRQVTLKVEGMTCPSCPAMIKTALKKLDGVVNTDVSYKKARATVSYQKGKVTVEQIIKAIEGAGFKAKPSGSEGK